jgi:hypothetical protein
MELYGATFRELQRLMLFITMQGDWALVARFPEYQRWRGAALIGGAPIKLTHDYDYKKGLIAASIIGKGWMIMFKVTKVRPHTLPKEVPTEIVTALYAPRAVMVAGIPVISHRHCFQQPSILSPEHFRTQMSLLRMFSSEWE